MIHVSGDFGPMAGGDTPSSQIIRPSSGHDGFPSRRMTLIVPSKSNSAWRTCPNCADGLAISSQSSAGKSAAEGVTVHGRCALPGFLWVLRSRSD